MSEKKQQQLFRVEDTEEYHICTYGDFDGSKEKIEIWGTKVDPYSTRVLMTLLEQNRPFKFYSIKHFKDHKPDILLKLNPRGTVPTVKINDTVFWESIFICEYLDETREEGASKLQPSDPLIKAVNRSAIDLCTSVLHRWTHFAARAVNENKLQEHRRVIENTLQWIENCRSDKWLRGPYFNGNDISLVDFAFGGMFIVFILNDAKLRANGEEPFLSKEKLPHLYDYCQRLLQNNNLWIASGIVLGMSPDDIYRTGQFEAVKECYANKFIDMLKIYNGAYYRKYGVTETEQPFAKYAFQPICEGQTPQTVSARGE